ncbi:gamma-glutamylcyclotransferase [[Mycoplasma] falconis]|uniref:Gamma-glutamylcyclotransferase n=1 Tax=[Mycoplasma] falconis TaxID=92403 RepID=A0A501XA21_9BACT|nr:gamma-glutamylcyclotransferase family protein [[Mycoplasma] falconis]TPE57279.1 gamma-glutamylcyclotransferase [[Mycoplasma] falconis]
MNLKEEKVYVFSYGTLQDPLFYENIFGKEVNKMPAILNGYTLCVDDSQYFLLKKDTAQQVEGTVFEINLEQLFAVDRWEMFPSYQRFTANVLLTEKGEILENVIVYTKLEEGKVYQVDKKDRHLLSGNPAANENNLKSFVEMEKIFANNPLRDNILLYEASAQDLAYVASLTHPYYALIIDDKENKVFSVAQYALMILQIQNKQYIGAVSFGQKNGWDAATYALLFENKIPNAKPNITWKALNNQNKADFINQLKPKYYLTFRYDPELKQAKLGQNNNALELVANDFNIDPFARMNSLIKAFDDTKNLKA